MKRHLIIIVLLLMLVSLAASAQHEPAFATTFVPDEKVHDFGTIKEQDGPVSHTFTLQNTGKRPIAISDVTAWCGCTTAEYTKTPIRPGQSGRVTVTFNPRYRPGKFSKEVVVLCNDGQSYLRLWVKGTVAGMVHPVTDDHPYAFGEGLYMGSRVLPFRALRKGETQRFSLRVANDTDQPMAIEFRRQPNNRVLQMPDRITLKPRERRVVEVSYKAVREYAYKRKIDIVPVVNGKAVDRLQVTWLPGK